MSARSGTRIAAALAAVLTLLALAAASFAASAAVTDCSVHNRLTRHYSVSELRTALATMPADIKEYTSCSDVLQRALDDELSGLHVSGSGGSGGGSFLPVPVIVLLAVVLLGGAAYGAVGMRRRNAGGNASTPGEGEAPPQAQDPLA